MSNCVALALADALAAAVFWLVLIIIVCSFLYKPYYRFVYLPFRVNAIKTRAKREHDKKLKLGLVKEERREPNKLRRYWHDWLDIGFYENGW